MEWVALSAGRCGSECVEYSIEKHAQNVILQEKHQRMLMRLIFLILLIS